MSISALRIVIPILFLVTLYFSQRYWVRSARTAIAAVRRPVCRKVLRAAWNATGILLLLAVLERFVPFHSGGWPAPAISRWSSEFLALWFTWSIFGFLAISLVHGVDWIVRRSAALVRTRPTAPEASDSLADPRRR